MEILYSQGSDSPLCESLLRVPWCMAWIGALHWRMDGTPVWVRVRGGTCSWSEGRCPVVILMGEGDSGWVMGSGDQLGGSTYSMTSLTS